MFRNVLAVIIGYATMVGLTMLSIVILAKSFGLEMDPKIVPPNGYLIGNLIAGVAAAMLGGWVCTLLVHGRSVPAQVLAGIVGVLGVAFYFMDTGTAAPRWYLGALPVIGVVGVLIGAALARGGGGSRAAAPRVD